MTPYGALALCQHWIRQRLVAWRHLWTHHQWAYGSHTRTHTHIYSQCISSRNSLDRIACMYLRTISSTPQQFSPERTELNHCGRVTHMCVSSLWHQWFRWLVACSVASHYPNQWRFTNNWALGNKLQWNFNWNWNSFIRENSVENIVCKNGDHLVSASVCEHTGFHNFSRMMCSGTPRGIGCIGTKKDTITAMAPWKYENIMQFQSNLCYNWYLSGFFKFLLIIWSARTLSTTHWFQVITAVCEQWGVVQCHKQLLTWWRHDVDTALLALSQENPTVIPHWLSCFLSCYSKEAVQQTTKLPIIWDAIISMWRHCNDERHYQHPLIEGLS